MQLALSCTSTYSLWMLCDASAEKILAETSWTDSESQDVASEISPRLNSLLSSLYHSLHNEFSHLKTPQEILSSIQKIFVVAGPGAFTGLRVSASFASGLARSLNIPLCPIPSFDLLGQSFQIPLQHQRQKNLPFQKIIEDKEDALLIEGPKSASLQKANDQFPQRGFLETPLWPSANELLRAVQKNLSSTAKMEIFYGVNPKISGQRI